MSLTRTALRLATLEALRPDAAGPSGPWPTSADGYVFDSRLNPIDDLAINERRPIAVVYTEHDNGDPGQRAGGPPFKRLIDVVVEIAVVTKVRGAGEDFESGVPETDAELEASLDLLEAQVRFVLFFGPTGVLWRQLTGRKTTDIRSLPHRTSEEGVRLAQRTMTLTTEVPDDCIDAAPETAPANLERLPQPLRKVVLALAETSYGRAIGLGLAPRAPVMPTAVELETVALNIDVGEHGEGSIDMEVSVSVESAAAIPTVVSEGAGVVEIDYARGHFQELLLLANVTAMTVVNWPPNGRPGRLVLRVVNTGNFNVDAWPANTVWPGGSQPTITQGAGKFDRVVLFTQTAGATVEGNLVGANYST